LVLPYKFNYNNYNGQKHDSQVGTLKNTTNIAGQPNIEHCK
jgi:hypothetical protein